MNKDLEKIGLRIASANETGTKLYSINNPDGSPRWIWNANNLNPDFLRFYAVSTFRARLFSTAISLIFLLKLQHFIFRGRSIKVARNAHHRLAAFTHHHFALFTGTPGPNRKLVILAQAQFIKVGLDTTSKKLLDNERKNLQQLISGAFVDIPECRQISEGIVSLSDLGQHLKRSNVFKKIHAAALCELYDQHPRLTLAFAESEIYQTSIHHVKAHQGVSADKIPPHLREKLCLVAERIAQKPLSLNWTHRDFTPWNCYESAEKIKLYDFELAHPQLPFGFDVFHFVMQQGILVDRLSWKQLRPLLKAAFLELREIAGRGNESFENHLQAYLMINTAYHIDLYSRQEIWHTQIHWLLNTWNEALSDLLQHQEGQRAFLIGDVFDLLHNEEYAAIKFPNTPPAHLSEDADIDLLVDQKTAKRLQSYLEKHSLVKEVKSHTQSKMMSLLVVLQNDQLLALDLIWKLRVKALDFMDVKLAIREAVVNDFGIKTLSPSHHQEYLRCFYGLNDSAIPDKYQTFFNDRPIDQPCFSEVKRQIKKLSTNRGFAGFCNTLYYAVDVVRQFFFQKGMVITFSGVDGAGKSTIIEHTKKVLEKRLRKKVVVIRHRPSLLPILSAITQGKQKAEYKAANTLPRQGNNKNLISSLLRFVYYYTDYLLGQFYVYAKHVLRGEIVLYDRYYFDFINDGLRSNICLPKWLTKAGYRLLIKPHLNFFLYADAETIISRKKELDANAITTLTQDYLALFTELDKNTKGQYYPIENLQLHDTISFITSKAHTSYLI